MNVFNRLFVIILALVLIGGAVAVITLAWSMPQESIDGLRDAVDWLEENNEDLQKTVLTAAAAGVGLLALLLLLSEAVPARRPEVKVTDVQVGDATLSTAAIGQRVEEAVRGVPHVAEARVSVKAKGRKGVQVAMDLHVDPDANLAAVSDEACQTARDVLTEKVHVALVEPPRARLHYRELRLARAAPSARPQAAPAAIPAAPAAPEEPPAALEAPATPTAEASPPAGAAAPSAVEPSSAAADDGSATEADAARADENRDTA